MAVIGKAEITISDILDGKNGATGKGIKSIAEKYAVSSSNSTTPTTWHDSVQTMTSTNRYLWNYEIVTYTDNTTSTTAKRVIGVYGDKGNTGNAGATGPTGATGKGIKSIANYYLVTSASSGVTTGTSGWSTTPGTTTTTNKYLWNYEKITYTDNTTTNTTPHIIGTHGATGATGPAGEDANQVVHQVDGAGNANKFIEFATLKITGPYVNHVISFRISSRDYESSDVQLMFVSSGDTDPNLKYLRKNGTVPLWIAKTAVSTWVLIAQKNEAYGNIRISQYQKNAGNVNLTWTSNQVATLRAGAMKAGGLEESKTATNYMNFDSNGLVIGDLTKGTLGRNVLIDADSVDIRNGTNTLATFSDNIIELGKGNSNSSIKLCDSVGEIKLSKNEGTSDLNLTPDYTLNINSGSTNINGMNVSLNADNTFLDTNVPFERLANAEVYASTSVDKQYVSSSAQSGITAYTRGVNERSMILLNSSSYSKTTSIALSSEYNDSRSRYSKMEITPDGINIKNGSLYDKYSKIFPNGVPVYGSGNGPDPNTTLDSLILSAHANAPESGFKYIYTAFYSEKKTTSNRSQFAIPYGDSANCVYYRFYYNGKWSAWYQLADQWYANEAHDIATSARDGVTSLQTRTDRAVNWCNTKHNSRLSIEWKLNSSGVWTMYFYIDGALVRTW